MVIFYSSTISSTKPHGLTPKRCQYPFHFFIGIHPPASTVVAEYLRYPTKGCPRGEGLRCSISPSTSKFCKQSINQLVFVIGGGLVFTLCVTVQPAHKSPLSTMAMFPCPDFLHCIHSLLTENNNLLFNSHYHYKRHLFMDRSGNSGE